MKALLSELGKVLPSRRLQAGGMGWELGRTLGVAVFVLSAMLVIWAAISLARGLV